VDKAVSIDDTCCEQRNLSQVVCRMLLWLWGGSVALKLCMSCHDY
jgi:hypothetical protein